MIVARAVRISDCMNLTSSNSGGWKSTARSFFGTGVATGAGLLLFVGARSGGARREGPIVHVELLDRLDHHAEEEPCDEPARHPREDADGVRALVVGDGRKQLREAVDPDRDDSEDHDEYGEFLHADPFRPSADPNGEAVPNTLARAVR